MRKLRVLPVLGELKPPKRGDTQDTFCDKAALVSKLVSGENQFLKAIERFKNFIK